MVVLSKLLQHNHVKKTVYLSGVAAIVYLVGSHRRKNSK